MNDLDALRVHFDAGGLAALQVALGFVMFGVALDLRVDDARALLRRPRPAAVGLLCQFVLLPALAAGLALAVAPTPSVALGMMLVAACPGGNVSNFLTQLAGGRVALSVGMTAVSTCVAVLSTPANLWFWGSRSAWTAPLVTSVALDPLDMLRSVATLLLLPVALGAGLAHARPRLAARILPWTKRASTLLFVGVVAAAVGANLGLFARALPAVFLPVAALNAAALGLGYAAGAAAGLDEADRRALTFEVGIQNSGLGLVLVFTFFEGLGGMAVVAAWWGIWHLLAGFATVAWFRRGGAEGGVSS